MTQARNFKQYFGLTVEKSKKQMLKADFSIKMEEDQNHISSLIKKEMMIMSEKMKSFGIDSIYIGINSKMKDKICLGSQYGMEFLQQHENISEDFYQFCQDKYTSTKDTHGLISKQEDPNAEEVALDDNFVDFSVKKTSNNDHTCSDKIPMKMSQGKSSNLVSSNDEFVNNSARKIENRTDNKRSVLSKKLVNELLFENQELCKLCGKTMLKQSINRHLKSVHNVSLEDKQEMQSELSPNEETNESDDVEADEEKIEKGDNSVRTSPKMITKISASDNLLGIERTDGRKFQEAGNSRKLSAEQNSKSKSHNSLERFSCNICGKNFRSFQILQKHLKHQHKGVGKLEKFDQMKSENLTAENVNKISQDANEKTTDKTEKGILNVSSHCFSKHQLECEFCSLKLASESSLKRHLRRQHTDREKRQDIKREGQRLISSTDSKVIQNKSYVKVLSSDRNTFVCNVCSLEYASVRDLTCHMAEKHAIQIDRTLDSSDTSCDLKFANESNLKTQIRKRHFEMATRNPNIKQENKNEDVEKQGPSMNTMLGTHNQGLGNADYSSLNDEFSSIQGDQSSKEDDSDVCHNTEMSENLLKNNPERVGCLNYKEDITSESGNYDDGCHDNIFQNSVDEVQLLDTERKNEEKVKCHLCNRMVKEKYLRKHVQSHDVNFQWNYSCSECHKGFHSKISLLGHLRAVHRKMDLFKCPKCFQTFHTLIGLKKHSIHCKGTIEEGEQHTTQKRPFTCRECLKKFRSNDALRFHMLKHRLGNWTCKECGLVCRSSSILNKHRFTHQGLKSFQCCICNSLYKHAGVYSLHLKNFHRVENCFVCKFCGITFADSSEVKAHVQNIHYTKNSINYGTKYNSDKLLRSKNVCQVCYKMFDSGKELREHSKTHKSDFICEECGKICPTLSGLKLHKIQHTAEKPFKCNICNKRCASKSNLKSHMKVHQSNYLFQCDECGKCFKRDDCLKHHLKVHEDSYSHKCMHCLRMFRSNDGLKAHILREHPETVNFNNCKLKYFKCEYCAIILATKQQHTLHVRNVHTGLKPHVCDICGASFALPNMLNRHKKESHLNMITPIPCALCKGTFKGKSKYRRHLNSNKHKDNLAKGGITAEEFEDLYPVNRRNKYREEKIEIDYWVPDSEILDETILQNGTECIIVQVPEGVEAYDLPVHTTSVNEIIISSAENASAINSLLIEQQ